MSEDVRVHFGGATQSGGDCQRAVRQALADAAQARAVGMRAARKAHGGHGHTPQGVRVQVGVHACVCMHMRALLGGGGGIGGGKHTNVIVRGMVAGQLEQGCCCRMALRGYPFLKALVF